MDLFLDDKPSSFFLELLTNYMQLPQQNKVNVLKLSSSTVTASKEGIFNFPSIPLLIDTNAKTHLSPLAIALYFAESTLTKDYLIGDNIDDNIKVFSTFELLERKKVEDLYKYFNDILETKTFLLKQHLTLADLYLFSHLVDLLGIWNDEQKLKFISILRWFNHVQNLPGIKEFLIKSGKKLVIPPKA